MTTIIAAITPNGTNGVRLSDGSDGRVRPDVEEVVVVVPEVYVPEVMVPVVTVRVTTEVRFPEVTVVVMTVLALIVFVVTVPVEDTTFNMNFVMK
jgi:hypothetical protein